MLHGLPDLDMIQRKVVMIGNDWIGIGARKDHMVANGEEKLVSVVVRGYVERMVCMHGVGLVGSYKAPHFHVMTTMRPLNPDGTWGQKQRREYLLDEIGRASCRERV